MVDNKALKKRLLQQKKPKQTPTYQKTKNISQRVSKTKYFVPIGLLVLLFAKFVFDYFRPYETLIVLNDCNQAKQIDTNKYSVILPAHCEKVENAKYWLSESYKYDQFVPCASPNRAFDCELHQASKVAYVTFDDFMDSSSFVKAVTYSPRKEIKKLMKKQLVKANDKIFIKSNLLQQPVRPLKDVLSGNYTQLVYNMFITGYDIGTDFINQVTKLNVQNLCNLQQKVNIFYHNVTQEQLEELLSYGDINCVTVEQFNPSQMCQNLDCSSYIEKLSRNETGRNPYHYRLLSNYLIAFRYAGFLMQPNVLINSNMADQEFKGDTLFISVTNDSIYAINHEFMYFRNKGSFYAEQLISNFRAFYNLGALTGSDLAKFVYVHNNISASVADSEAIQPAYSKNNNINSLLLRGKFDNSVLDFYSTSHDYFALNLNKIRTLNQPFCEDTNLLYSLLAGQITKTKVCQKEEEIKETAE